MIGYPLLEKGQMIRCVICAGAALLCALAPLANTSDYLMAEIVGGASIVDAGEQGNAILWQFGSMAPAALNIFLLSDVATDPSFQHGPLIRFRMKNPRGMLLQGAASLLAAEMLVACLSALSELLAGFLIGWSLDDGSFIAFISFSALLSCVSAAVYSLMGLLLARDGQSRSSAGVSVLFYIVSCMAVASLPSDSLVCRLLPACWGFSANALVAGLEMNLAALLQAFLCLDVWLLAAIATFLLIFPHAEV